MSPHDMEIPGEDQIHAALDEAINVPLARLLAIEEFVEKVGRSDDAAPAIDAVSDLSKAA
jgi:hypothetical protein